MMRRVYRILKLVERLAGALAGWIQEFTPEWDAERKEQEEAEEKERREGGIQDVPFEEIREPRQNRY